MKKAITLLAAGAVLATGAQAQITKQGTGYLLRYKFVKGQTMKYGVSIGLTMGGAKQQPTKLDVVMKVLEVKNGIATLKLTGKSLSGQPMDRTVKMDSRGRVQGQKQTSMETLTFIELPEKPVPIGGTFKAGAAGNVQGAGQMTAKSTFKLVSVGTVNGKAMASFSMSGDVTGIMPMKVVGALKLLSSDGSLWSSQSTASGQFSNPQSTTSKPTKFAAVSTVTRQ